MNETIVSTRTGTHASDEPFLRTLQLVTTPRPFFERQVDVLERYGISCTVVTVPNRREGSRSIADYLQFYARTVRQSIARDFDVVHANYGLTAPAALAQPERPVVLTLWGSDVFGKYHRVSERCAARSDAVIVMSDEMASQLPQQCSVIPHGVDTNVFEPRPTDEAKAELGWDRSAKHVLFPYDPSRPVKNYSSVESVVETADEEIGQEVQIHTVHGVSHSRMPVYMNAADALLLTSTHEGSPNSVKEALSCNLPVVSVDVGDVREVVSGVSHCYVCRSEEALTRKLITVLQSAVRSDGRKHVERFSLDRMGRELIEVYEAVLDR